MKKDYHSFLFVPVTRKMLSKIETANADAIILDLEDAIPDIEKEEALQLCKEFISKEIKRPNTYIRLNKERMHQEMQVLSSYDFNGYMIPKIENDAILKNCQEFLRTKEVIGLVETAKGMTNIESIVSSEYVSAVAFGAEDYTCSMNMENNFSLLIPARSRIVMYAKAYHKPIIDSPSFNYSDMEKLEKEVEQIVSMGFDGKMAIHPKQVQVIERAFRMHDVDVMKEIVDAFDKQGGGVLVYQNKVYEKPHIKRLKNILRNMEID